MMNMQSMMKQVQKLQNKWKKDRQNWLRQNLLAPAQGP